MISFSPSSTHPVSPKNSATKRTTSQRSPSKSQTQRSNMDDEDDSDSLTQYKKRFPNKRLLFTKDPSSSIDDQDTDVGPSETF
jgi:hypothetical protein